MVSTHKKSKNLTIGKFKFFLQRIFLPIFSMLLSFFILISLPMEGIGHLVFGYFFSNVEFIKMLTDKFHWIYYIFCLIVSYEIVTLLIHKILQQEDLLLENRYYLVPTWMIKFACKINQLYSGSATSIPVWQFCEYNYNRSSWGWRKVNFNIPDVPNSDSGTSVKVLDIDNNTPQDSSVLSLVVADTYDIAIQNLPEFVLNNNYKLFQTLQNNKCDRLRRYNPDLTKKILTSIKTAEESGVKSIYLLLNTNPKQVDELFREAFCNAGRDKLEHLYVYANQANPPYFFDVPHRIF